MQHIDFSDARKLAEQIIKDSESFKPMSMLSIPAVRHYNLARAYLDAINERQEPEGDQLQHQDRGGPRQASKASGGDRPQRRPQIE